MTSPQAEDFTGASYRQLDHWVRKGWLDAPGMGSGSQRVWRPDVVEKARVMKMMGDVGILPEKASEIYELSRAVSSGAVRGLDVTLKRGRIRILWYPPEEEEKRDTPG